MKALLITLMAMVMVFPSLVLSIDLTCSYGPSQCSRDNEGKTGGSCQVNPACVAQQEACNLSSGEWCWSYVYPSPSPTASPPREGCYDSRTCDGVEAPVCELDDVEKWRSTYYEGEFGEIERDDWLGDFNCDGRVELDDWAFFWGEYFNAIDGEPEVTLTPTLTPTSAPSCDLICSYGPSQCSRDNPGKTGGSCQINPGCVAQQEACNLTSGEWCWSYCR